MSLVPALPCTYPCPRVGLVLYDQEGPYDGIVPHKCATTVADPTYTRLYIAPYQSTEDPTMGWIPPGYQPVVIAGIQYFPNLKQPIAVLDPIFTMVAYGGNHSLHYRSG